MVVRMCCGSGKTYGVLLTAVLALSSFSAQAGVDEKQYAKCAAIEGDLERLECYDQLARDNNLVATTSTPPANGAGKWEVSIKTNPVDDSKTVSMALIADSGVNKWDKPIYMIARCKSNKTDLFIVWHDYLGSDAYVLTRIGKEPAETSPWSMSTDNSATFHESPATFLTRMMTANKLVAQVTPYNENPITAIFDTTGMESAIKPLRETCGW